MTDATVHTRLFSSIRIGEESHVVKTITEHDVVQFAQVSGDQNPLHVDETYAKETLFGGRIVHGMYLGSLVSQVIGMQLPGKYSLLLTESLEFKKPAKIGDTVTVSVTVTSKSDVTKIIELAVLITKEKEILVTGNSKVKILI